ncbi:hypothetical protein QBZ16_003491 [Prototheca wickerhamii]|uniref:RING-type domain-containing protein n=1 Tax=Prototheca wickerhamii TaxID=3111 RepID=A0AAD9IHL8_PROWI|nr:hypothetical protein QBZ16_003491 [Prototheca wickerhamii]
MHPFFSVSLYTGQQLVLAGLQRWVFNPYKQLEQRRQRASLRALVMLLVKTAATGMLAALLDAAIDYRTRQLVALAGEGPAEGSAESSRLLQAIDEMERRAELYGLGPSSRAGALVDEPAPEDACKGDAEDAEAFAGKAPEDALAPRALSRTASSSDRGFLVSQTILQLQELMRRSGSEADSRESVEESVDRLLDNLLGVRGDDDAAAGLPHGDDPAPLAHHHSPATASRSSLSSCEGADAAPESCPICMDAAVRVAVGGCGHGLCFGCARQLCRAREHTVPACPFCRQPIEGFELRSAAQPSA